MPEDVSKIAITAVLVEGIITYINEFFISGVPPWQMILSLILGIVISVAYKFDLPKYLKMESQIPYVGCILTGILISRGSNYVYDTLKALNLIH
ncbi:hypothetical protein M9Y10_037216 [Tritrichomonas musculus]|uniref:Holin n=1 Tax=Tritrichomonas musculus TaxID=1915356 RepID=A0ABR2GJB8_9EUKA